MSEVKWKGAPGLKEFLVPVGELVPHPQNPSRGEEHVEDVSKSLRDFQQVRPVLTWLNADGHGYPKNTIIAGHHVWRAAMDLGWTHVAVIPSYFESEEEALQYLVVDNVLTQRRPEDLKKQLALTDLTGFSDKMQDDLAQATRAFELQLVEELKIHERSVRKDPEDVIRHISENLREHGFTDEHVVVARDGTILVGESVLEAAALAGFTKVPVTKLDIEPDSPEALRVMAKGYGIGKRAMVDDRAFAEILKNIHDELETLEGTGYDTDMLANLIMVSRTTAEIRDANQAMEWIGLPEYEKVGLPAKLILSFDSAEVRDEWMTSPEMRARHDIPIRKRNLGTVASWWPPRERDDVKGLRFVGKDRPDGEGDKLPAHDLGKKHADLSA